MRLQYYGNINRILSRALYCLNGLCCIFDGIGTILSCGYWYPNLAQKATGVRMWFMRKKNKQIEAIRKQVACDIYTKKKSEGI